MTEYLETTVDKFIFKVATDRYYSSEGLWAKAEGNLVRIGLSDFLQQRSGDVAFADVNKPGTSVNVGDEVATIETIKVNISLTSPVRGRVVEVNPAMASTPEAINQDPYGPQAGTPPPVMGLATGCGTAGCCDAPYRSFRTRSAVAFASL